MASSLVLTGCFEKKDDGANAAASAETPEVKGRKLYVQLCLACHNTNPNEDGLVGPANAHSSMELLRAKVLKNEYPAGYTPKRTTKSMTSFPLTEDQLASLHAYLNSVP